MILLLCQINVQIHSCKIIRRVLVDVFSIKMVSLVILLLPIGSLVELTNPFGFIKHLFPLYLPHHFIRFKAWRSWFK